MDERRREEESSLRGYEHEFERAAEELRAAVASKRAFVSDAQKIKLYSLFKQATEGDCAKPQPSTLRENAVGWILSLCVCITCYGTNTDMHILVCLLKAHSNQWYVCV